MKKSINLLLLSAIALTSFSAITTAPQTQPAKEPNAWEKTKAFVDRNKGKIAAGIAATAAAIGLYYHGNKTMEAIEKAGITPNHTEYDTAIAVVGLLGPIGEEQSLKLLKQALDKNIISEKEAAAIIFSDTGAALAYYFEVSPTSFRLKATKIGLKSISHKTVEDMKEGFEKFKKWASF